MGIITHSDHTSHISFDDHTPRIVRWAPTIIFLLALMFNWPYLMAGFYADDFVLVNAMAANEPHISPWLGAWITTDVPAFDNLWWKDSGFGISFWRPIPSLILQGATGLFGKNPLPLHGFSIIMHAIVALLVFGLARRLAGSRSVAFLAGLLFVTCEDHTVTVAWISTVADILCTLATLLSLLFHFEYLRQKRVRFLLGSILSLVVALACKETAAVTPIALILMTLLIPYGSGLEQFSLDRLRDGLRQMAKRPLTWVPQVSVLIAYLVFYKAMGFGIGGSLQYIDPISEPAAFVVSLASQLPVMFLGTLSVWPPFASGFDASLLPYVVLPGIAFFALWIAGLWPLRRRVTLLWAMSVYFLAIFPQLCTVAGERGLYFPMAIGSILLAVPMVSLRPIAKRLGTEPVIGTRWTKALGWTIFLGVLVMGVVITSVRPWLIARSFAQQESAVRTAVPFLDKHPTDNLIITNASDIMQTFYWQDILKQQVEKAPDVWILSAAAGRFVLERTGESSFVMRTDRPGWINNTMARYVRTDPVIRKGQVYETKLFTATVEEVTADETDVLAMEFDFAAVAQAGSLVFMTWNDDRYEPLYLDTIAVGSSVELSPYRSIWETTFPLAPEEKAR